MIKVLIVEDSLVAQELLIHILTSDPEIRVVGVARNGEEAIEAVSLLKPDIITMDIHMPKLDGFAATRKIMATQPTPIVVVSGSGAHEVATIFKVMEAGALAIVQRPPGVTSSGHKLAATELLQTVKLMSEIKVVKRLMPNPEHSRPVFAKKAMELPPKTSLIAIGASTGGPIVLQKILGALPRNFSKPILVVQHIAVGFAKGFVDWLAATCALPVVLAEDQQQALPGQVYVAPDNLHLAVDKHLRMYLQANPGDNGPRPSVSILFRSVAENIGSNAIGILLSGMGKDGAEELKLMRDNGAITIAQSEESSIVFGMPGEAVRLNAATHVFAPEEIIKMLGNL